MLAYIDVHVTSSQPPNLLATTPRSPAGLRRLPPTPTGSSSKSATSSPTNSFAMPEPEPYYEPSLPPLPSPQRPTYSPVDSYMSSSSSGSNDLLRRATASANNRRLPQAPNGTPDGAKPPVPPLPYEHRPSTQASYDSSISSLAGDSYESSLTRLPTYRPPGALPPTIPGRYSVGGQSPTYDLYNGDVRTHNANGYYKPVDTRQFQAPMLPGTSNPQSPVGLPRPLGQEYLTSPSESVHSSLSFTSFPTSTDATSQCLYLG
jgi:RHO1 GDP-GTP exchange protein 1/2